MDTNAIRASLARQSQPPAAAGGQQRKSSKPRPRLLSKFIQRFSGPAGWVRSYPRHSCCIVGVLVILGRNVPIDGLVTEVSRGGALFRPASDYIFDRNDSEIALRFAEREWRGRIVNVKQRGYGISWEDVVTEEEVEEITSRFGMAMPSITD
jgi:hypothetical protein